MDKFLQCGDLFYGSEFQAMLLNYSGRSKKASRRK